MECGSLTLELRRAQGLAASFAFTAAKHHGLGDKGHPVPIGYRRVPPFQVAQPLPAREDSSATLCHSRTI